MRTTERKAVLRQFFKSEMPTPVDGLIDAVIEELHKSMNNPERYSALLEHLDRLNGIKAKQRRTPMSRDTMAIVAGNLLGILIIVAYENKHVMTSKGFTQIIRPKGATYS